MGLFRSLRLWLRAWRHRQKTQRRAMNTRTAALNTQPRMTPRIADDEASPATLCYRRLVERWSAVRLDARRQRLRESSAARRVDGAGAAGAAGRRRAPARTRRATKGGARATTRAAASRQAADVASGDAAARFARSRLRRSARVGGDGARVGDRLARPQMRHRARTVCRRLDRAVGDYASASIC